MWETKDYGKVLSLGFNTGSAGWKVQGAIDAGKTGPLLIEKAVAPGEGKSRDENVKTRENLGSTFFSA